MWTNNKSKRPVIIIIIIIIIITIIIIIHSHIGHCSHTSESINVKYKRFNMANSIICATNCDYRIAAEIPIYPRNMVCLRNIIVIILPKDNNNNE